MGMTNEEAIRIAQGLITDFKCESETMVDFCNTVIRALKQQEPCEDAVSRQEVLDIDFHKIIHTTTKPAEMIRQKIKDLSSVKPQESQTEWIPIEWRPFGKSGYPKPEDEYKRFLTIDDKDDISIQEFLLSLDEEPQPYFTGMRKIIGWMPLPKKLHEL